jgi:hypothetical protein
MAKRMLSWVLALALLTTCAISGLVLPASANENLLTNGDFEQGTTGWENNGETIVSDGSFTLEMAAFQALMLVREK